MHWSHRLGPSSRAPSTACRASYPVSLVRESAERAKFQCDSTHTTDIYLCEVHLSDCFDSLAVEGFTGALTSQERFDGVVFGIVVGSRPMNVGLRFMVELVSLE